MATKAKKAPQEGEATLTLTDLKPAPGSTRTRLRVGRGRASGAGKTSNRGHNGEGQRSGNSRKRGFEGGQMPAYRRMPKIRSCRVMNPKNWLELNVHDLESLLTADEHELTYDLLIERGLLRNGMDGVRLLGNGDIKRKVVVHAHHVTPAAREKVEAAGGSVKLLSAE